MRTTTRVKASIAVDGPTGVMIESPTSCDINHAIIRQATGNQTGFTVTFYSTANALPGQSDTADSPDPACFRIHPAITAASENGFYVAELSLAASGSGYIPYRDYDAAMTASSGYIYMLITPQATGARTFDAVLTLTTGRLGS